MADYDVIVIGAGCGGISAGAILAKQGRKVLVLEQSDLVGGCCSTFEKKGFKFDIGASIVEIVQPIEKAFEMAGSIFQKEVDLISCDPIMSIIRQDGSRLTYPISVEKTGEIISAINPQDGKNWFKFAEYCHEMLVTTIDTIFDMPANSFGDMAKMVRRNPKLLKFLPAFLITYQDLIARYFKDPRVVDTMTYQSLYFGHPPVITPGSYGMVPYSEHEGIYYPRGGMIKIPEGLMKLGQRNGMEIRFKTGVKKVMIENGRAVGVVLEDGTPISAKVVVSNINARTLYMDMIGEEHLPKLAAKGIKSYEYSTSVPMIYLGLNKAPNLSAHHSVFAISPHELNSYQWNNVDKGILPDRHLGLICWPSHSDDTLAPKGKHVLNIIPEGFYTLKGKNWDEEKPKFIERVLENLEKKAIPGLRDSIEVMECSSPLDYERRLRLPHGAIYAFQQDLTAQAMFRVSSKSKVIKGLYITGSSAHPGGGVPSTIASGVIASRLIDQYEK
jgi:phytoene desaturase